MNHDQFDNLTRKLGNGISRRDALKLLAGGLGSVVLAWLGVEDIEAKPKPNCGDHKHCKKSETCCDGVCVDCSTGVCGSDNQCCPSELVCDGLCCDVPGHICCKGTCLIANTVENCGTCGHNCEFGQACCGGKCTDLGTLSDCKECGDKCADGTFCCPDSGDPTGLGYYCTSGTTPDNNNCGTCGNVCTTEDCKRCIDGVCKGCDAGLICCSAGDFKTCFDPLSDNDNCGGCGIACGDCGTCINGTCMPKTCPAGLTCCNGSCLDTQVNQANCGGCGITCGDNETCINGECRVCPVGFIYCNNKCVDPLSDPNNCGICGNTCNGGNCEKCENGVCQTCPSGYTCCNPGAFGGLYECTDLLNDRLNCGSCGNKCGDCELCLNGTCTPMNCPDCTDCNTTTGTCDSIDCGSPCLVCVNRSCQPKCSDCESCDPNTGNCSPICGDPCLECVNNSCQPKQCPPGQTCQNGACLAICGAGICPPDYYCWGNYGCVYNSCDHYVCCGNQPGSLCTCPSGYFLCPGTGLCFRDGSTCP